MGLSAGKSGAGRKLTTPDRPLTATLGSNARRQSRLRHFTCMSHLAGLRILFGVPHVKADQQDRTDQTVPVLPRRPNRPPLSSEERQWLVGMFESLDNEAQWVIEQCMTRIQRRRLQEVTR